MAEPAPLHPLLPSLQISTHSRLKGGWSFKISLLMEIISFNTQPPEGGWINSRVSIISEDLFQHTAARRRLVIMAFAPVQGGLFQHTAA